MKTVFIKSLFLSGICLFLWQTPLKAQVWEDTEKVIAQVGATNHRSANDRFSGEVNGVDIYLERSIVGAPFEDENAAGGGTVTNSGAAYIIEHNGQGDWDNVAKLIAATSRNNGDNFGHSVSLGGSIALGGNFAVIGAPYDDTPNATDGGSVYIFEYSGGTWSEIDRVYPSDAEDGDHFGWSVSIYSDIFIVGAPNQSLSATGGTPSISEAGAVYFFDLSGNQMDKVVASNRKANDHFGWDVDLVEDNAIVGAPDEDEDASNLNTEDEAGSAFILIPDGGAGNWIIDQKIVPNDRDEQDQFGYSVGITDNYAIIGAYSDENTIGAGKLQTNAGSAYIFNFSTSWSQQAKLISTNRNINDRFGVSVDIDGDYAIVGAHDDEQDANGGSSLSDAGSAEIFERDGTTWPSFEKIDAFDREALDEFGWSVALDGEYAAVGAQFEDDDASGGGITYLSGGSVYFSALCVDPVITSQTNNQYCVGNGNGTWPAAISVTATGGNHSPSFTYKWFRNSVAIPSSNSNTYSVPQAQSGDDFYCEVTSDVCVSNSVESVEITVTSQSSNPGQIECPGDSEARKGNFKMQLNIFPNPVNETLTVQGEVEQLEVFNALGERVEVNSNSGEYMTIIETQSLKNGMYVISFLYEGQIEKHTVVVQH